MKRFIIFTVSLLIIGWLNGECQTVIVSDTDSGFRISGKTQAIDLSTQEYELFSVFVSKVIEELDDSYFTTKKMVLKTIVPVQVPGRKPYNVEFVYDTYFGFTIDDGDYIEIEPLDIMDAMIRYMEKKAEEHVLEE